MIPLLSAVLGAVLGLVIFWLLTGESRQRARLDREHLAECTRQTRLAARALEDRNEEAYEAHMVLAMEAFDRISRYHKKEGS